MPTISAIVPFLLGRAVAAAGGDPVRVWRAVGLDAEMPAADAHVPVAGYFAAWRAALAETRAPTLPLKIAAASQLEDSEVFGFLAMSCETLLEAFQKTAQYRALYVVGARWELALDATATRLIWYPWPGDMNDEGYRAANVYAVADMANAIERLGKLRPRAREVSFTRPPHSLAAYRESFGVTPAFSATYDTLVYAADLGEQGVCTFNSRLRDYFDAECRALLAKLGTEPSIVDLVRNKLILAMDGGDTSIETIAKALALSPRTLQRRLSDEGTRYAQLLDDVRIEFAKRYLSRKTISASEVAYLVGFTEPPAFFKAFKRWTGMTPGAFQML